MNHLKFMSSKAQTNRNKEPILSLCQVSKAYTLGGAQVKVLDNIELDIFPGDFISIVGPSGSGKSTLMHIASFLDSPTTGQVILNGKTLKTFTESQLAKIRNRTIGFIFQQFNLLSRANAIDNVALPLVYAGQSPVDRQQKAIDLLNRVGLGDRLHNRPNQLSGGQQQRVAIARALINDPQIIFADEPTGNLDSKSGDEVMHLLKTLNETEGRTVVLVTHEQEVAEYARRQIYIKDGKIINQTGQTSGLKHKGHAVE